MHLLFESSCLQLRNSAPPSLISMHLTPTISPEDEAMLKRTAGVMHVGESLNHPALAFFVYGDWTCYKIAGVESVC